MKKILLGILAFALLAHRELMAEDYRVKKGDILNIEVLNEPDLSGTRTVSSDGKIAFPLIGMVDVKDLTLTQISKAITGRLDKNYVRYPSVTVSLEKRATVEKRYFVYGQVKSPGQYTLPEEPLTVLKALALAGGLTSAGADAKVVILRAAKSEGDYETLKIDLGKVMNGSQKDAFIQAEDILTVRQGWF